MTENTGKWLAPKAVIIATGIVALILTAAYILTRKPKQEYEELAAETMPHVELK
ncbi:hypothetical protein [Mucilaginibacter terrenus]|uniref:hypothetical protein n=1 Tax=Mucilaginibacter terrenus TaxID=2482727 RepID=UPI001402CBC0|nr:hypothetical protein [Mucilaginibacter terrenus]